MKQIDLPDAPRFALTQPPEATRHAFMVAQRRWAIDGRGGRNPYQDGERMDLFHAWQSGWEIAYDHLEADAVARHAAA